MQNSFPSGGGGCGTWYCPRPRLVGGLVRLVVRHKKLVAAVAVVAIGFKVAKYIKMKKLRAKWDEVGPNVVVLHTIARGNTVPSITPFSIKLETFFRMMGIEYELEYEVPMGPKHKVPWITINGKDYSDSELIVDKLQVLFGKFPDKNVPKEDRAVGLAMRVMLEEHLYWGLVSWRYIEDNLVGVSKAMDIPPFMLFVFKNAMRGKLRAALYAQGLGRHSTEDLHLLMRRDLKALSTYLGEKPFMYGADPHVVDCSVFGTLCQFLYTAPNSPYLLWINEDFPNLKAYTERVKQRLWPDWDKCIRKPNLTL